MPNTSATGGPLTPAAVPAPLEGEALNDFLQEWIVGIVGLAGAMVRPRYQAEPPNIPAAGAAWMAFGTTTRPNDTFPAVWHDSEGDGADTLQRHETINILCSFYDLGTNGLADKYAALLRDGLAIAQNLAPLAAAGMGLVECGETVAVPSLLKIRWLYRVDLPVVLTRQIDRIYPVENIESFQGTLVTDVGVTLPLEVPAES